jgi:diaminohydroxyphosphoribosylaminopyrimidine deaminase/5-amino-6-(5-phosphoribosylamino)uracil reductase
MTDEKYMSYALTLAKKGIGYVNPNPLVGAVIVKNGEIIGRGWHEAYGGWHAEINALTNCTDSPEGATMYVTLEPCCHSGKTPPCTEAILQSGLKKVVIGCLDSNPLMSGKGALLLENKGLEVVTGILQENCKELNEVFFHYIKTKTPFVVMKYAMTMDGKIASVTGESRWITSQLARDNVHRDRNQYTAIMVGVGTVIADNPSLTCRIEGGRNPIRIICDTNLNTPLTSCVVTTAKKVKTIIATACASLERHKPYIAYGCEILVIDRKENHLNLNLLMQKLGEKDMDSILLEGGATLNFSALQSNIVNKVQTYIAPKLLGGELAKSPVGGIGILNISDSFILKNPSIKLLGEDILIESEVAYPCLPV